MTGYDPDEVGGRVMAIGRTFRIAAEALRGLETGLDDDSQLSMRSRREP